MPTRTKDRSDRPYGLVGKNVGHPGRDIIVGGIFSPTRQLVRISPPEHNTYSKLSCHHFKTTVIIKITEINTRWLGPLGDSQDLYPKLQQAKTISNFVLQ